MKSTKIHLLLFIIIILCILIIPGISRAWSPSPYTFTFVLVNPPEDLEITPIAEIEQGYSLQRNTRLWETRFTFTISRVWDEWLHEGEVTFRLSSKQYGEFAIDLPVEYPWRMVVYVDFASQTFSTSPPVLPKVVIIFSWILALVPLEIALFFLFGYQQKRSWKIFAIENMIIQGIFFGMWIFISFFVLGGPGFVGFMAFVALSTIRIAKLITDCILYPMMVNEHSKGRGVGYALTVNGVGCYVIIVLMTVFPRLWG